MVRGDFSSRWPILVSPLGIYVALRPGNDGDIVVGNSRNIVDGVCNILGIALCIVKQISRNVEPYRVCIGCSRQQWDEVSFEGDVASAARSRN